MSRTGDLLWSHKSRAVMRYVIVALLVVVAWQVSKLADRANEEKSTATATEAILAEACGAASVVELEEQGLVEECRLAQEGNLGEALVEESELPEPDVEPEDVDPDVIEDDPDSVVTPAPLPQGPSNAQVDAAVDDYLTRNPINASPAYQSSIRATVATYLTANPPRDGRPPTEREIRDAVRASLLANPPADGTDGADGDDGADGLDGRSVTTSSLEGCDVVFSYSDGTTSRIGPICGPKGEPGDPPTPEQIRNAVDAYCTANGCTGPQGPPGVVTVVDNCPPVSAGQQITDVNLSAPNENQTMTLTCEYALLPAPGNGGG